MKKALMFALVVTIAITLSTTAFASKGGDTAETKDVTMSIYDSETGLSFVRPAGWEVSIATKNYITADGTQRFYRELCVSSENGKVFVKFTELRTASLDDGQKFVITDSLGRIFYVSGRQALTQISGLSEKEVAELGDNEDGDMAKMSEVYAYIGLDTSLSSYYPGK